MSIARNDARIYIARIIGGANDPKVLDMAEEALIRGFSDWQTSKDWEDTLKDTSLGFTVDGCSGNNATLTPPTSGAFDGVNIGVTITVSGHSASLAAGTTVLSYTRNTDGTIASITISNAVTSSTGTYTATFGADIPILAGVQDYNVPSDFFRPYMARLTSKAQWPIEFIRPRFWNRRTLSSTVQGLVEAYTVFNVVSPNTQNFGTKRLRLYRVPSAADVLQLTYYRKLNATSDPLDMDTVNLYKFLDMCRSILLDTKRAQDNPDMYIKRAASGLQNAMTADEEISEDNDIRLISQMEIGDAQRPLWTNGPFNPDYGF